MHVEPYLCFNGRCEEALDFYRDALGAEVTMLMRFKDSPEPHECQPTGTEDKVMHATVKIGESTIMASDGRCEGLLNFEGISLSIGVSDVAQAKQYFEALSQGGEVQMPLAKTFWSPGFGMVADRFGVSWMINVVE